MTKSMKKFLFVAVALFMATACLSEEDRSNSWSTTISDNMVTTNVATGEAYTDAAMVIVETKDITKPYINLTIEGVRFVAMMPDVNFVLENIPFKLYASDDKNDPLYGSWVFSEKSIVPTVGGVPREEYTMLNFNGTISNNGLIIDFDVNFGGVIYHATFGKNDALQTWTAEYSASAIVVLNPGEGSTSTTDELTLQFSQANLSKQVVDITVKDLRFVPQMPEIVFVLKDVPFSYSEDGTRRLFNVASVVPQVNGEPYTQYTMSTLTGSVSNSTLTLDCDIAAMNAHISISGTINK